MSLPNIHLCVVHPAGYVHALGLLDPARYFRYQFRRLGAAVTMSKNRLQHGAVNFVFGAHLGFDPAQCQRYTCIFVNLEQLGAGGAAVSPQYLDLLRNSAVVDYDTANLAAYTQHPGDVPLAPFVHAPYLAGDLASDEAAIPLEQRPIDLLFFGSMNERRRALLARVAAQGLKVSVFDGPLYGPERDAEIRRAKAVLNAHFYASSRFEQVRVSHCLSLGTPVLAERSALTVPPPVFEDAVTWFDDANLETVVAEHFRSEAWYAQARLQLAHFAQFDPAELYADIIGFAKGFGVGHARQRDAEPWSPTRLNLGSGKDYLAGWLNVDVLPRTEPDLVLDLSQPLALPAQLEGAQCGPVRLAAGQFEQIYANNVLEHVPDLPALMTCCLALLQEGGRFIIEVPHERARTAWQDPTHLRALNENSWLYYTDWFWYLGWFEHRFRIEQFQYLDVRLQVCDAPQAAFMRVMLQKMPTTALERVNARALRAECVVPDDVVPAEQQVLPAQRQRPLQDLVEEAKAAVEPA